MSIIYFHIYVYISFLLIMEVHMMIIASHDAIDENENYVKKELFNVITSHE